MKTGENFIKRFESLASKKLNDNGFTISIQEIDTPPSNSTKVHLEKNGKEYLIWFADNRLDYDSGVKINRISDQPSLWGDIIFPDIGVSENVLSFYPVAVDRTIGKLLNFLLDTNDN